MNKYQETLNKQIKYAEFTENTVVCLDIEVAKGLLTQPKSPTLEEVKREWKVLGYEEIRHERRVLIFERKEDGTFFILSKFADVAYEKHWNGRVKQIHFQEHQLLTKTFKALGWL